MAYVKHEWKTGDVVSSVKLNEMENGIAAVDTKSTVSVADTGTATDEVNYITIDGVEKKIAGAGKEGKVWKELSLNLADTRKMIQGKSVYGSLSPDYDPENFRSDYFVCNIEQSRYSNARTIFVDEDMEKVYINVDGYTDIAAYFANTIVNLIKTRGFDHNYYRTLGLYGASPANMGKSFITDFDGYNVMYIQDVSQQDWEYNYEDPKYIDKMRREALGKTELGKSFVISVKGKNAANSVAFLICLQSSQTSYLTDSGETKWANIEAGKVYPVHFDDDTLRWMLDNVAEVESRVYGVEMTAAKKTELAETGIEFSKDTIEGTLTSRRCAAMIIDKAQNINADCYGVGDNELTNIFSFNSKFGTKSSEYLEYIGRPNSYQLSTFQYTKEIEGQEIVVTEKDGYHLWVADVEGVPVELIIPDNIYAETEGGTPVPHRDTYIVRINFDNISDTDTIFRHTFTITTPDTVDIGQWELNLSMCAVNANMGDDAMEYLLHSDETGQTADWILPISGTVGRVIRYNYKGDPIQPKEKYKVVTLTPAYDLAKFEDLWENLPKQRYNKYYIFYGTDPDQSRLINMRIEKEDIEHAFDLYVYDDYDIESGSAKPYIRFVTQAIGEVQKGFYMWDTSTHAWGTQALEPEVFYEMFNSNQGVQGVEKVEIEGDNVFVGWDNNGLFEIFSSAEGETRFRSINVVAHTFTAMRMIAGWQTISEGEEEKQIRTLYIDYIDKANEWTRIPVITDYNRNQYWCRDFRSEVLTVKTPVMIRKGELALAK